MKKLFILVPFILLAACGSMKTEVSSCVYDTKKNTKTCELTSKEISEIKTQISAADTPPQVLGYTRVEGKDYSIMSDGTLVPSESQAALAAR